MLSLFNWFILCCFLFVWLRQIYIYGCCDATWFYGWFEVNPHNRQVLFLYFISHFLLLFSSFHSTHLNAIIMLKLLDMLTKKGKMNKIYILQLNKIVLKSLSIERLSIVAPEHHPSNTIRWGIFPYVKWTSLSISMAQHTRLCIEMQILLFGVSLYWLPHSAFISNAIFYLRIWFTTQ